MQRQHADDILEALGPLAKPVQMFENNSERVLHHPAEIQLNEQERAVLDQISSESTPIDQVVSRSGLPVHRVLATISVLEMRRLVRRISGQHVVRG